MALQCNVTLNYSSYSAGATPPPMATVTVYNPNAVAVMVQSIQMQFTDIAGRLVQLPVGASVPPIGPGMNLPIAALSSTTFGPFPLMVSSAAVTQGTLQSVDQTSNLNPRNPQASQPAPFTLFVGASVYGSDASVNTAGFAALTVSPTIGPPPFTYGGVLQFNLASNSALLGVV